MFDPEKVERVRCIDDAEGYQIGELEGVDMVRASDYDQLLALYRELQARLPTPDISPERADILRLGDWRPL